jgi:hypothetical protein
VAAAQEQAAASVADFNIARGEAKRHERNQQKRLDGAQGGKKRHREWEAHNGQARGDQTKRLELLVRSVLHDDVALLCKNLTNWQPTAALLCNVDFSTHEGDQAADGLPAGVGIGLC